jgi:DNA ligase-1
MLRFAELYLRTSEARGAEAKREALDAYLAGAPDGDAAIARRLIAGERPRRVAAAGTFVRWAAHESGVDEALARESVAHVGDAAEAAALMLDTAGVLAGDTAGVGLAEWIERLAAAALLDEAQRRERVGAWWRMLSLDECIVFNKLASGTLRLVARARIGATMPAEAPDTINAVLMVAQPSQGRRASLCTDYTLGVWSGAALVAVASVACGLADAELAEIDRWARTHTVEKFGPARSVEPGLVFEVAFERVSRSARRKSGIALAAPRVVRWLREMPAREADTIERLLAAADAA